MPWLVWCQVDIQAHTMSCHLLVCCAAQVINVTPRYAKLLDSKGEVFGWENMELISGVSVCVRV